jgi:hypothetical protein
MPAEATLAAVVIDSACPAALADFYTKLTGLDITYSDDTSVYLGHGPVKLGFQRVEGYRAPGWPDPATHSHIDFTVAGTQSAAKEATALGAGRPDFQPAAAPGSC